LARMLGDRYDVINLGVGGRTLLSNGDSPYIKTDSLTKMAAFRPEIVVIMLGTNDTKPQNWRFKAQFVPDYLGLIARIQALDSKPRILLCTPPFSPRTDPSGINEPAVLEEIPMIESIAKESRLLLIDIHGATAGKPALFPDGIHPKDEGANLIAGDVYRAVTGHVFTGDLPAVAKSEWNGFGMLNFEVDGRNCFLVEPKTPLPGNPWIWRTEFFGAYAQADVALLAKGYYLAFMDAHDMYGAPAALDHFDKFYDFLLATYHLSPKPVLEGFSRGGLYAFNWAARNPDRVAAIYADAPVCDFKSWPGGKGKTPLAANNWQGLLRVYGFTEQQALAYKGNPVDNLAPLAAAKVPILGVYGEADTDVPPDENILLLDQRYRALGGEIKLIPKPGAGHHPHSLANPAPIVDFILAHAPAAQPAAGG